MRNALRLIGCGILGFAGLSGPAVAWGAPADCSVAALSRLNIHGMTIGDAVAKAEAAPAFCDVTGTVTTSGAGAPDGSARFEIKLPVQWNGKFLFWGVGGLAGGLYPSATHADIVAATAKGYATAVTDTGHQGGMTDASWALTAPGQADDAKLTDYYFRAVHDVTVAAKQLVGAYYGAPIARSYFDGCSNGGRQGLVEASRYPDDYDGIVAGAPFMDLKAILAGARLYQTALKPSAYIPAALLPTIDRAIMAACDGADGVKDGLIQNPAKCAIDAKALTCKAGQTEDCLTAEQAAALQIYFSAARDDTGRYIYPGGAITDARGGMDTWIVGTAAPDDFDAAEPWGDLAHGHAPLAWQFSDQILKYIVARDPNLDLRKFKIDAASVALFSRRTEAGNADSPKALSPFVAKGNKLLIYHGFSDPALSPFRTVKFYEELAGQTPGGYDAVERNVRLLMVPGMQHCGFGSGPNVFDTLSRSRIGWNTGRRPTPFRRGILPETTRNNRSTAQCRFVRFRRRLIIKGRAI
jgi:feruloyl esterase